MGFLAPALLAGLLAIAVPIALHLRHRDKDRPYKFPSLMFLEQLPIRTAQRRRVTDWPLLLLRVLALVLLALAFARPVFNAKAIAGDADKSRAVVVLLDRSASMGHKDVWPAALDSARAVIAALRPKDRVGVVYFDDASEIAQRMTEDKGAATAVLGAAKPLPRGTRFAPALRTARQMLLDAPYAAAEIVVVSDLQRSGTVGIAGIDLPAGVTLRAVNVGAAARSNSAVRAVEAKRVTETTASGPRSMLAVKARVVSRELAAPRIVQATLVVNGRDATTQTVTLPSGEFTITFAPVFAPESDVTGTVRLAADALDTDDSFRFVVPRDDAVKVALVVPDDTRADETLFMERALGIGRAPEIAITRVRGATIDAATLRTSNMVVLWDVLPSQSSRAALESYMTAGGGVTVVASRRLAGSAGSPASPTSGSANAPAPPGATTSTSTSTATPAARTAATPERGAFLPAKFTGMSDRLADRGGTLTGVRFEHPLFAPFRDVQDALVSARFFRYPRMDVTSDADILARFDDGLPAIVEKRVGAGRLLVVAASLDGTSGDFALQPAYLPFLRQMVMHTSGRDATPLWRTTADNWSLPESVTDPVVRAPDEELLRPGKDSLARAVLLADAGHYALFSGSAAGEARQVVAVNVPTGESDLTPVDPKELSLGVGTSEAAATADAAPPTPDALERRQNAWRILLVIVALALLGETFMATRGWRAVARRYPSATTDR
ncbi:MAG TPA: BatA domain-containing protein, partial [Gemmatimonas sp.]|nr:BatA domain-containing protein [Gemmatimonas sp.]